MAVVSGAGGLIGSYFVRTSHRFAPTWRVHGLTRSDLDLTNFTAVHHAWRDLHPQLVIHCAALSKPQVCQEHPSLAHTLNVEATALLAELAAGIPFVFLSTDQVFDGRRGDYVESDPINPVNLYGETKAAAEQAVLCNSKHMVIRTSLNGGVSPTGDRGFNEEAHRAWVANRTLTLFTDEFRCPIPAIVTVQAVWELVDKSQTGLFHVAGAERLSRWTIGQLLAARWPELNPKLEPGSVHEYTGPTRPPDLSLDCAKVQKCLSFPLPKFSEWLTTHPEEPF